MQKYIRVPTGTTVNWKVSCEGFDTQSGSATLDRNETLEIELIPSIGTLDVTNYEYTLENDTATLTKYIGSNETEVMPSIER